SPPVRAGCCSPTTSCTAPSRGSTPSSRPSGWTWRRCATLRVRRCASSSGCRRASSPEARGMRAEEIVKVGSGAAVTWPFLRDDGTPSAFIHRACRREMWRESGAMTRLGLLSALLAWPVVIPVLVAFFTWRNGADVRRRTGKAIIRQMGEQTVLALTRSLLPPWYYIFELHDDGRRRRAGEYLNRFETKRFAYAFLARYNGGQPVPAVRSTGGLSSKVAFAAHGRAYRLPSVAVVMDLVGRSSGCG